MHTASTCRSNERSSKSIWRDGYQTRQWGECKRKQYISYCFLPFIACEQAPKEIGERSEPRRAWGRIKIGGACRQRFYAAVPSTRRAPDSGATSDWPDCWLLTGLIDILICRRHETRYDQNFHFGSAKCKHDGVFWRWASYGWSVSKSIKRFIKGIRRHKTAERRAETLLAISGVVETRWQAYTDPYVREICTFAVLHWI